MRWAGHLLEGVFPKGASVIRMSLPKYTSAYLVCFVTGFVVLVVELVAFRLLAPYFGMASHVTGIVINGVLLALAVGYYLGGYVADRWQVLRLPYVAIFLSAVYLIAVYALYTPLLLAVSRYPATAGVAAAVVAMFFIPVALLALVPPYFIKAISRDQGVGRVSGRIYAVSTLGSILGGLATTFLLIPNFGSRASFLLAIVCLLVVALPVLPKLATVASTFFLLWAVPVSSPGVEDGAFVYQEESAYNHITVTRHGEGLFLRLNDGFGQHSATLNPDTKLSGYYYDNFLFPQMLVAADKTLILGNGSGTIMSQTSHFFETKVDGVELDPKLTAIGQAHFGLQLDSAKQVYHQDARVFVRETSQRYDVICLDVYAGGPYIPFHVATVEFFAQLRELLTPEGILAVNLPFFSHEAELGEYLQNSIASVFPGSTYVSDGMAFSFNRTTSPDDLAEKLNTSRLPEILVDLGRTILSDFQLVSVSQTDRVFSDDFAPIEKLTAEALSPALD